MENITNAVMESITNAVVEDTANVPVEHTEADPLRDMFIASDAVTLEKITPAEPEAPYVAPPAALKLKITAELEITPATLNNLANSVALVRLAIDKLAGELDSDVMSVTIE